MPQLPTTLATFQQAWKIYKERWLSLTLIILLPLLIVGLFLGLSLLSALLFLETWGIFLAIPLAMAGYAFVLVGSLFLYPAIIHVIKNPKGKVGPIAAYKKAFSKFWLIIALGLFSGILTGAASLLLIIPGIILGFFFSFSMFILVEEDVQVIEALSKSCTYFKSAWKEITLKYLAAILAILILFALPIILLEFFESYLISNILIWGLILFAPAFANCYQYVIYENIKDKTK